MSGLVESLPLQQLHSRIQAHLAEVTVAASSERKLTELKNMAEAILGADSKRTELVTRLGKDQDKVEQSRRVLERQSGFISLKRTDPNVKDDGEKGNKARARLAVLKQEAEQLKEDANTSLDR